MDQRDKIIAELIAALEPFAVLGRPKTWPDAPGETGRSRIDIIEGKDGTGELSLGTDFGTTNTETLWRHDFEKAAEASAKASQIIDPASDKPLS